jgi:Cu-processing system ATP-binding protein
VIEIRGLAKRFGARTVLHGVDLAIAPERVTGIVGPNGAGKTTLMKSILGLVRPDTGVVIVDGRVVDAVRDASYRARIGYMPQIARFPENLSAAELFAMLRDLRGDARPVDEQLLRDFGLHEHFDKPLRVLSGGTRQKVNAALAFAFSPDLLILDEPTAGLDPVAAGVLKDKIAAQRALGRTVVITSHILAELDELCDDVVFLLDGSIRYAGSVHDLKLRTRQFSLERAIATMMTTGEAA